MDADQAVVERDDRHDATDIAVTLLPNGHTRMYVGEGHTSATEYSRLYRSDEVESGSPVFTQLTSNDPSTSALGHVQLLHRAVLVVNFKKPLIQFSANFATERIV